MIFHEYICLIGTFGNALIVFYKIWTSVNAFQLLVIQWALVNAFLDTVFLDVVRNAAPRTDTILINHRIRRARVCTDVYVIVLLCVLFFFWTMLVAPVIRLKQIS